VKNKSAKSREKKTRGRGEEKEKMAGNMYSLHKKIGKFAE